MLIEFYRDKQYTRSSRYSREEVIDEGLLILGPDFQHHGILRPGTRRDNGGKLDWRLAQNGMILEHPAGGTAE